MYMLATSGVQGHRHTQATHRRIGQPKECSQLSLMRDQVTLFYRCVDAIAERVSKSKRISPRSIAVDLGLSGGCIGALASLLRKNQKLWGALRAYRVVMKSSYPASVRAHIQARKPKRVAQPRLPKKPKLTEEQVINASVDIYHQRARLSYAALHRELGASCGFIKSFLAQRPALAQEIGFR